ncbi:MAG: DNRLRE domain-containing protein [Bacteroidota bacterium]
MRIATLLLAAVLASPAIGQTEVTLTPTRDNTLYEDANGALSNGAGPNFFSGVTSSGNIRRGLLAFDIAGTVPAGAQIQSVTLRLRMTKSNAGPTDVSLHRVTADWGEAESVATGGGGGGGAAMTGDATWIHTFSDASTWTTPGGDFDASASASANVNGLGVYTWSSDGMTADVQAWLDNPSANFGWIVVGDESRNRSTKRFASREALTGGDAPSLIISYTGSSSTGETPELLTSLSVAPNPSVAAAEVSYTLASPTPVRVEVVDALGRSVSVLTDGPHVAGRHRVSLDRPDLPAGVYAVRIQAGSESLVRQVVLVR